VCDHIQWLQKVGYLKLVDLKKFDEYHSKGWFFGLAAGFLIAAYKFKQALDENKAARAQLNQSLNDPAKLVAANKLLKAGDEKRNKQIMAMVRGTQTTCIHAHAFFLRFAAAIIAGGILHAFFPLVLSAVCHGIPRNRSHHFRPAGEFVFASTLRAPMAALILECLQNREGNG
jgi:hypothetical protein